jgi:hypothetical protein
MTRYHVLKFSLVHSCTFHGVYTKGISGEGCPTSIVHGRLYLYPPWCIQVAHANRVYEAYETQHIPKQSTPRNTNTVRTLISVYQKELPLVISPRLGSERASIPTEHRRVLACRIGKMRGLPILSQHMQTSYTLTNLVVNNGCRGGVDSPLPG